MGNIKHHLVDNGHSRPHAICYIRKSKVQRGAPDPASPEMQEAECAKLAARLGLIIPADGIFKDAEGHSSGRSENRPALKAMLERAKQADVAAVIVYKYNRLYRKTHLLLRTLGELKELGVAVHAVISPIDATTPQGYAMLTVNAAFDQMMADENSIDRIATIDHLRREKGRHYGFAPFGTERIPRDGDLVLVPSTKQQANGTDHACLTAVYERYCAGDDSIYTLTTWLNRAGWQYRTRRGTMRRWDVDDVRRILHEHHWTYAGYVPIGRGRHIGREREIIRGSHDPILPAVLTAPVAAKLAARLPNASRRKPFVYPLSGILHCECTQRLRGNYQGNARHYRHYEHCTLRLPYNARADDIEAQVRAALQSLAWPADIALAADEQLIRMLAAQESGIDPSAERERLQGSIDRLSDLYADGEITREQYQFKKAAYVAKIPDAVTPSGAGIDFRQLVASYGLAQRARRLGAAELQTVATAMYERITTRHNHLLSMAPYEWCAEWAAWSA